jgi:predicted CoA-substrate-specific enzyme activase
MRILGIDLGSREVKIAVMENKKITFKSKIGTMVFYRNYCSYDGKLKVELGKLNLGHIDAAISTGYGRNNTDLQDFKTINELKAHVYGALFQTDFKNFTLLDVGGQDVKVVKVEKEMITDLELNEKCAASCGRYLENMANVLEISLEELSLYYEDPVEINATCAVFSESSLIGMIAQGVKTEKLCAGVNFSLYKRLQPLLNKFNSPRLILSGGVAKNKALIHYLRQDYDEIISLDDPQFNGAIGCCFYANQLLNIVN